MFPGWIPDHIVDPAMSALLESGRYAPVVIDRVGRITELTVDFDYGAGDEPAIAPVSVALGLLLARRVVRRAAPKIVSPLRAVHNGSVNDCAGYAIGGMALVVTVLAWL